MNYNRIYVLAAVLVIAFAGSANAASFGPGGISWGTGTGVGVEDLLGSAYFNGYTEITDPLDFDGMYNYTAIAHESGNINIVKENPANTVTFSTSAYGNWGVWDTVDFDSGNLHVQDNDTGANLDPFSGGGDPNLKVFKLDAASNPLDWLISDPTLTLAAGTLIVGWNDNTFGTGDDDYDDIILAMKPVPEPGTVLLLGFGLAGLGFAGRRRMKK